MSILNEQDEQAQYQHYSMIIEWSHQDNTFIATVPELLGCEACGPTRDEAVKAARQAIVNQIDVAQTNGQPVPQPKTFAYWSPFTQAAKVKAAQDASV